VIEHVWRVDGGNADTVHELYVPDGTLNLGEEVLKGKDEIRKWGQEIVENHTFDGIRHICGNMRFFETGEDTAEGVTVLTVYFDKESKPLGTSVPWTVGEDHDQYVRTEKGWLISARRWVSLFERRASDSH
jgi:hypothetical protein